MRDQNPDELVAAMQACRRHFLTAAAFSFALNVLHLTAPLYMMQVYDRVISSGSGTTLAMLTLITLVAFGANPASGFVDGMIYQFRVFSTDGTDLLSSTEDLRGVFQFQP